MVFIPKSRWRTLYYQLRQHLGEVFRKQKEGWVEEGHLLPDHVLMMLSKPRKNAVTQVVGHIRGSVRSTLRGFWGAQEEFRGPAFSGAGYFVSAVGRDEAVIRKYIRNQAKEDKRLKRLGQWR